jgi:uncharacterized protein
VRVKTPLNSSSIMLYRSAYLLRMFLSYSQVPMLGNVCKNHRCTSCCYDTEMLLLDEDLERISGLGYHPDFFSSATSEGFKVLKNSKEGRCVFHDGTKCTIYENRPAGCMLYPIVFNEDSLSAVKDYSCPFREEFPLSWKAKKQLSNIYPKLLRERENRLKLDRKSVSQSSLT